MMTEDDFQKVLDKRPNDWQTRLVFADWLQERGDPRAEGYRALSEKRREPLPCKMQGKRRGAVFWVLGAAEVTSQHRRWGDCLLPRAWYESLPVLANPLAEAQHPIWKYFNTRREAEDAAALAFSELPAKTRAELLRAELPARRPRAKKMGKPGSKRKRS